MATSPLPLSAASFGAIPKLTRNVDTAATHIEPSTRNPPNLTLHLPPLCALDITVGANAVERTCRLCRVMGGGGWSLAPRCFVSP